MTKAPGRCNSIRQNSLRNFLAVLFGRLLTARFAFSSLGSLSAAYPHTVFFYTAKFCFVILLEGRSHKLRCTGLRMLILGYLDLLCAPAYSQASARGILA